MICKLCKQNKTPKSNTHYLTDFIIRSALNEDGVGTRGKGLYWSIDTTKSTIDFKFQQHASPIKLENLLGRLTTEKENNDAQNNLDFSVNDSFCKDCEDIFTHIENQFGDNLLSKFRTNSLTEIYEIILNEKESEILRLFFLMQFWRTSECDPSFKLSNSTSDILRLKILNKDSSELEQFPLSITYLETLKDEDDTDVGEKYKTENVVSPMEHVEPYKILMGDFVLQLYENLNFPFDSFYGYNKKENYLKYLNHKEKLFIVKIIHDKERREIQNVYFRIAANQLMAKRSWFFLDEFTKKFNKLPSNNQIGEYLYAISKIDDIMIFTLEKTNEFNKKYFESLC